MGYILAKWFIVTLAILFTAKIVPGIYVESLYIALIIAVLLALLNLFVRPIIIILTLPINIITLGLFIFVINGFLFWFVSTFVEGFQVQTFFYGLIGAILVSVFSWLGNVLISKIE